MTFLPALVALPAAWAADVAFIHAQLLPVSGPPIEDATVLVTDGRIEAFGAGLLFQMEPPRSSMPLECG